MRFPKLDRRKLATGACLAALTFAAASAPAVAQVAPDAAPAAAPATPAGPAPLSEGVIAVVNDNLISSYDLVQRIRLLSVTAGVQPTEESLPQLQAEALRGLVDERLQMQELRRVEKAQKITIISTDKEIDEEIASVAQSNNTTPTALLASLEANGISAATYREQLRASVSWQSWIGGRYGSRVRIGQDQIKAVEAM